MATQKSSPEHIVSCLDDLRRVFGIGQKTTAEHLTWQNGLYIEALSDLSPEMLSAACKHLIKEGERFPKPREIREVARDLVERQAAKRALANPHGSEDIGTVTRNEAILLMGSFHYEVASRLKSPSEEYKNFLAEAANAWSRARPEGGLGEIDAQPSGRRIYGFAMEAWARKRIGARPLHPAYVCSGVARVYSLITGQPIETLRHEDDALQAVDGGPWAKWSQARSAAE